VADAPASIPLFGPGLLNQAPSGQAVGGHCALHL